MLASHAKYILSSLNYLLVAVFLLLAFYPLGVELESTYPACVSRGGVKFCLDRFRNLSLTVVAVVILRQVACRSRDGSMG